MSKEMMFSVVIPFYNKERFIERRIQMYSSEGRFERVKLFGPYIVHNSHFGRKFCSLGLRAFAKDLAFILGMLR